jgi:hypothetical protein
MPGAEPAYEEGPIAMNGSTGRWVGIDVAKGKLDVALLDENDKVNRELGLPKRAIPRN